jgi:glycerol transport system permease protein
VINFGFHDIFTLSDVHWVGPKRFADILGSDRLFASLGRSLLFSALVLAIQVPLGLAVALPFLTLGRHAVWGLMLVALPLSRRPAFPAGDPGLSRHAAGGAVLAGLHLVCRAFAGEFTGGHRADPVPVQPPGGDLDPGKLQPRHATRMR